MYKGPLIHSLHCSEFVELTLNNISLQKPSPPSFADPVPRLARSISFFRFFVSVVADEGFSLFYSLPPWRKNIFLSLINFRRGGNPASLWFPCFGGAGAGIISSSSSGRCSWRRECAPCRLFLSRARFRVWSWWCRTLCKTITHGFIHVRNSQYLYAETSAKLLL